MKVLLVTSMFPPYCGGGVSAHVRDLAHSLAKAGQEVWILTSRRGEPVEANEQEYAPSSTRILFCDDFRHMVTSFGKLVRTADFDIVHFHSFNTLAMAFLDVDGSGASVFTMHCDSADYQASLRGWRSRNHPVYRLLRMYERLAIRLPNLVIAVTRRLCTSARSLGAEHPVYIPNAVDCDYWSPSAQDPSHDRPVILIPRRLVPTSGVEHAIRAMNLVVKNMPDAILMIAGDGNLRNPLEQLAARVANGSVRFLGEVQRGAMRELYRSANVVLIPSVTSAGVQEGSSVAVLEAMACGTPIVASGIGGLPEQIRSGVDGFLVREGDPAAIANALTTLLRDESLNSEMGANARDRAIHNFSTAAWAKQILSAYSEALRQCDVPSDHKPS